MKKLKLLSVLGSLSFLLLAGPAFASIGFTPSSPQLPGASVHVVPDSNHYAWIFDTTDTLIFDHITGNYWDTTGLPAGTYHVVECDNNVLCSDPPSNQADAESNVGFVTTYSYVLSSPPPPPPPFGISFLGGTAPSVGSPLDGSSFKSGLSADVGSTMDGLGPIAAWVGGIIVALILLVKIIGLIRETSEEKGGRLNKMEGHLTRKSQGLWIREK